MASLHYPTWKLTLPTGRPGRPDEIIRPRASVPPWYVIRPEERRVICRANAGGVTTRGSKYPRTELRELVPGTERLAGWDSRRGFHQMTMSAAIHAGTQRRRRLVCAQMHNGDDDVAQVRLEDDRLFVEADGDEIGDLDPDYDGHPFQVRVAAGGAGVRIAYTPYRGRTKNVDLPGLTGRGWYFKAGMYLQSNVSTDAGGAYGEMSLYGLKVTHLAA